MRFTLKKHNKPSGSILALFCVMTIALSACQTPPLRSINEKELANRHPAFLRSYQSELDAISEKASKRIEHEYRKASLSGENKQQTYDMLVLSGGGAFGAFGAGFLKGWGKVNKIDYTRPQFDSISGISTGSLLAPFAFIGTPKAYDSILNFYQKPGADWARKRGIIPYLPGNVSVYDVSKLHKTIKAAITPEIIENLAKGSVEGRQLLVGATNMDYGLLRVWDLAQIASETSTQKAIEQTVSILSASTAIPGLFPPEIIDDLLYVDGGATMQMVGGIDDRSWAYKTKDKQMGFVNAKAPIKIRVWIIVNQKLLTDAKVVRSRWTSIASRSLNTLIRASTLQSIQDTETLVQLVNRQPEFDAEMRYVAIPQDFPIADSDEIFDAKTMHDLVKLGLQMGADPTSWKTEALRPGAPFVLD